MSIKYMTVIFTWACTFISIIICFDSKKELRVIPRWPDCNSVHDALHCFQTFISNMQTHQKYNTYEIHQTNHEYWMCYVTKIPNSFSFKQLVGTWLGEGVESHNFFSSGRAISKQHLSQRMVCCTAEKLAQLYDAVLPGVYTCVSIRCVALYRKVCIFYRDVERKSVSCNPYVFWTHISRWID